MKKLLLIVAVLFIAADAMAQNTGCNVYVTGTNPDPESGQYVFVGKNDGINTHYYFSPEDHSLYKAIPEALCPTGEEDTFILAYDLRSVSNNGIRSTRVIKKTFGQSTNNTILSLDETNDPYYYHIEDACYVNDTAIYLLDGADNNGNRFSYIFKHNIFLNLEGVNDMNYQEHGQTTSLNYGTSIDADEAGNIYASSYHYKWKGEDDYATTGYWSHLNKFTPTNNGYVRTLICIPTEDAYVNDIEYRDGYIYACGYIPNPGNTSLKKATFWRWDGNSTTSVIQIVLSDNDSRLFDLSIDGGYIYVTGWDGYDLKTWKRPIEGFTSSSTFDLAFISESTSSRNQLCISANSTGVYTGGYDNSMGCVWKDGAKLYDYGTNTFDVEDHVSSIENLFTTEYHDTPIVHSLPFATENFMMGHTDWRNWRVDDNDDENGRYNSFWERYFIDGRTCARHRYNYINEQDGDLYSPMIQIPNAPNKNIILRFESRIDYLSYLLDDEYDRAAAVYAALPSNQSDFFGSNFSFVKIADLKELHNSGQHPINNNMWSTYEVMLPNSLKGQVICLDFYYYGYNAHNWYITNVSVESVSDGIEEEGESVALSVMPNPANDFIRVNGLNGLEVVNIYNTLGQVVKSARLSDGESLNISNLSAGIYMLRSENSAQVVKFTVK